MISYRIINAIGQIVKTGKTSKEIVVDYLEAGLYVIQVNDGDETITKQFIK